MSVRTGADGGLVGRSPASWGWLAVSGVLGLVIGVLALIFPVLTVVTAGVLLGIVLIVQGVLELTAALRAGTRGRIWLGVFGALALVAGVLVLVSPGTGVLVLVWGVTLWFLLAGIHDLIAAATVREHRGWNIALGVISVLAFLILLFSPGTAIGVLSVFIALGFLFRGGADLGLALALRRN